MITFIIFPTLSDGIMATPCAENINGMGMGYSFEVPKFEAQDLNEGEFGYQFKATDDDLDIVFPDGKVEKQKGKIVRLSKSKMKPKIDAEKFNLHQAKLLNSAKALIGQILVQKIGSITAQLNASTSTNPDVINEWQPKFQLRDEIKFIHGRRLKDAILGAKKLDDLEKIKLTMTENFEGWANGE